MPGILLLAHGGPSSLDEIPGFLEQVRGGRPYSEEQLNKVREKYRLIGGASPLPAITYRAAEMLEAVCEIPVYVGMLHWHPFIEDVVSQMAADEVSDALVICLSPYYSDISVGRYRRKTQAAADRHGLAFSFVDSWGTLPSHVEGLAGSVIASWQELGPASEATAHVVFSAHSLPRAALSPEDTYESQLRATAAAVAQRLGIPEGRWTLAYQSMGERAEEWLGPSVEDVIHQLAERGVRQAVICPFGFLADQVEILYDLDIVMKQKAKELVVQLVRAPLLNDGQALIDSLATLVRQWRYEQVA